MIITRKSLLITAATMITAVVIGSTIYICTLPSGLSRTALTEVYKASVVYGILPALAVGAIAMRASVATSDRRQIERAIAKRYLARPGIRADLTNATALDLDVHFGGATDET